MLAVESFADGPPVVQRRQWVRRSDVADLDLHHVNAVVLAPLLPGLVQQAKGRLQGRRGPSPLQPYRELRRLWGKSAVEPEGTTLVYRLAPAVVAAVCKRLLNAPAISCPPASSPAAITF